MGDASIAADPGRSKEVKGSIEGMIGRATIWLLDMEKIDINGRCCYRENRAQ